MNPYNYFIGSDLGKTTLAVCVLNTQEKIVLELIIPNTKVGMETLLKRLEKLPDFTHGTTLHCMEHTGIYCQPLVGFFYPKGAKLWLDSAVRIKHSLGIKRGKTDKADARAIARYCIRNHGDCQLFALADEVLCRVRQLAQQRDRLMEMAKELADLSTDYKAMNLAAELLLHQQTSQPVVAILHKQIALIERQIQHEIKAAPALQTNFDLLTSIPGVGKRTAIFMLVLTGNFSRFTDPKKLASYSGIAPFAYESGTSVRGRTKVNRMANMKLKCLLHLASLGAIKREVELRAYYERKVAEGKNKMSVLHAVRNKIVHRMVAVIERQTAYEPVWDRIA
ncbi:IS110 family transposase [Spirosoma panaciterrae]|uniref:IS110 family transposase n=1 Tax=Spirosoma panaciterrae TaxID=496058 RepID=UPI0003686967|nr:IS110 family transposase [Spirosoma panaciterrae]